MQSEDKFLPCVRNMMQQETGDLKESEYGNVDFGTPTDDEEVMIPSQDRNKEVPDFPDIDIRDEQTLSIHNEKTGCTNGAPARGSPATDQ